MKNSVAPRTFSRSDQFAHIVDITRQMRDCALAGEWETVAEMQSERQRLVTEFFETRPADHEAGFLRTGIEEILAWDKEVMTLGSRAKEEISGKLAKIYSTRKAAHAYLDAQK